MIPNRGLSKEIFNVTSKGLPSVLTTNSFGRLEVIRPRLYQSTRKFASRLRIQNRGEFCRRIEIERDEAASFQAVPARLGTGKTL
jgi:hypothetical protein